METPNGLEAIVEEFGDISLFIASDGTLSNEWHDQMLGRCILPFSLPLDWSRSISVSFMTCHKKMVGIFESVFEEIVNEGLQGKVQTFGGCFNYRAQRGGTKLSTHAWGIAIDLNPFENQQGTQGNMDQGVIDVFQSKGFTWGGNFQGSRRDPMHFQFATGY